MTKKSMIKKTIKNFFELEAATGILLLITTVAALFLANSAYYQNYNEALFINLPIKIDILNYYKDLNLREWINDALMAIFFLLVGMELKKEILDGELSSRSKVSLPLVAAFGGVIVPAAIFYYFNSHIPENLPGFAIPTATDIAFAYGAISLFGNKFSHSLKVFLVALAVIDDLVAILIIAIFYSQQIQLIYLFYASLIMFLLFLLNSKNSNKISIYLFLGALLWLAVLKSGLHATLAGVLLALFIPLKVRREKLLENFAHKIAPFVNFIILPIFAFANAGVRIENFSMDIFKAPLVLGIIFALFFGKQIGVMFFAFIAVALKITNLPRGANWIELYVAAIFTGIGFTMSLFIGSLAFLKNHELYDEAKIGVLAGSLLSIVFGIIVAGIAIAKNNNENKKDEAKMLV